MQEVDVGFSGMLEELAYWHEAGLGISQEHQQNTNI